MAKKKVSRGRASDPAVRKGERVGPDYPSTLYDNPVNAGIEHWYEDGEDRKTLVSPNENTLTNAGLPLRHDYDKYWEGSE